MNILILFAESINPMIGGVERVYDNLSKFFIKNSISVYAYYRQLSEYDKHSPYSDIFYDSQSLSKCHHVIKRIVEQKKIDIIICGFPIAELMVAAEKSGVKVIHHIHNVPSLLFDNQMGIFERLNIDNFLSRKISHIRMRLKFNKIFKMAEGHNNPIVLLSDSFRSDFLDFQPMRSSNILAIHNPITINDDSKQWQKEREKIILFVGRLSEKQKNVSSLLRIWKNIQNKLYDYELIVLGDGPDRSKYEQMAKDLELERYSFEGFKNPADYYLRSSILLMTSNFEGFGMVLLEAMQHGCVPFAYHSFASLTDVIDNGKNGFIAPAFDEQDYSEKVINFLNANEDYQRQIRKNALLKANSFDVANIGKEWIDLFNKLLYAKGNQ